jgi:two-component system nitrogen regulation response regulator NtrX
MAVRINGQVADMTEEESLAILLVDDEQSVRRTFEEWLQSANLGCQVHSAVDAENALAVASRVTIDLAILDWNLGAGHDGLRLLEDLHVFQPEVVAILVTGYAHQATPLAAMRMGVRDYLDKNQELDRDVFLRAVGRQLERIRPAKRERLVNQGLRQFRESLEGVLPLVQSAAVWNDPLPLPEALRDLIGFMLRLTRGTSAILIVRFGPTLTEQPRVRLFDAAGAPMDVPEWVFENSIAACALSLSRPAAMAGLGKSLPPGVELQCFERGHESVLAIPLATGDQTQAVIEIFDKHGPQGATESAGFEGQDEETAAAAAILGSALFRQAVGEKGARQILVRAIESALDSARTLDQSIENRSAAEPGTVAEVSRRLAEAPDGMSAESLRLLELIRDLDRRHGSQALAHCTRLVADVGRLLDSTATE